MPVATEHDGVTGLEEPLTVRVGEMPALQVEARRLAAEMPSVIGVCDDARGIAGPGERDEQRHHADRHRRAGSRNANLHLTTSRFWGFTIEGPRRICRPDPSRRCGMLSSLPAPCMRVLLGNPRG